MPHRFILTALLLVSSPLLAEGPGLTAFNEGRYLEALEYMQPLADEGNREAQYRIGLMYARGLGVSPSARRAVELLAKAAEAGHYQAAVDLGNLYKGGALLPEDQEQSARWLALAERIAKEQGGTGSGSGDCD